MIWILVLILILGIVLTGYIMYCLTQWERDGRPNPPFALSIAESVGDQADVSFQFYADENYLPVDEGKYRTIPLTGGESTFAFEYWLGVFANKPVANTAIKLYGRQEFRETDPDVDSRTKSQSGTFTAGEGEILSLRVYHSIDGVINIDFTDPANLTGLYTINAADLIFQPNSTWETAVSQLIANALDAAGGYAFDTDFHTRITAFGTTGVIRFSIKHWPVSTGQGWIGINGADAEMVYKPNNTDPNVTVNSVGGSATSLNAIWSENTPVICGLLNDSFLTTNSDLSSFSDTYHEFTVPIEDVTPGSYTKDVLNCDTVRLTVSISGTATSPAYDWEYSDGGGFVSLGITANTIDVIAPGTYRVKVTADEGTVYKSYVIT